MTLEGTAADRRRAPRHRVGLTMAIAGQTTRTVDVSSGGIRFEAVAALAPGAHIEFTLRIGCPGQELRVDCEGEVIRVDRSGQVAATIETMKFEQNI